MKIKTLVVRFLLAILILIFGFICLKFLTRQILIEKLGMDNGFTRLFFESREQTAKDPENKKEEALEKVNIDWKALYPYTNGGPILEEKKADTFSKFTQSIKAKEASLEEYTNVMLPGYQSFVEAEKMYEKVLQWNITSYFDYDSVATLKDGYLTTYCKEEDITYAADAIIGLSDFLKGQKIPFLYVQAPFKVSEKQDVSLSGKLDFSNQNANRLLKVLSQNGVAYLDSRTYLNENFANYHEAFYKTDHHWKPETGLEIAGLILEEMSAQGLSVSRNQVDAALFVSETKEDFFLGSWGKRVTLSATSPEDFTLLYPNYETNLSVQIPERNLDVTGDFSVLYNLDLVKEKDYYNGNPYEAYIWGNNAVMHIQNQKADNATKVLIVKDSFGNCVSPFLSLGVSSLDVLDLRHFTGSLETYVETEKPDYVILLYNAALLNDTTKGYDVPFNLK